MSFFVEGQRGTGRSSAITRGVKAHIQSGYGYWICVAYHTCEAWMRNWMCVAVTALYLCEITTHPIWRFEQIQDIVSSGLVLYFSHPLYDGVCVFFLLTSNFSRCGVFGELFTLTWRSKGPPCSAALLLPVVTKEWRLPLLQPWLSLLRDVRRLLQTLIASWEWCVR